jgi:hypothetical protein
MLSALGVVGVVFVVSVIARSVAEGHAERRERRRDSKDAERYRRTEAEWELRRTLAIAHRRRECELDAAQALARIADERAEWARKLGKR